MGFGDVFVGNDGLGNNGRKWEKVKVGDLMGKLGKEEDSRLKVSRKMN
jgi:hypothetical protein